MFFRMLLRSLRLRQSHSLVAMLAIVVAAAVSTALLNLYADLDAKLTREFRRFGANVLVVAREGKPLPSDVIDRVQGVLTQVTARPVTAVPAAYVIARSSSGEPVVVAGIDVASARSVNGWWQVAGKWPLHPNEALLGKRAAEAFGVGPLSLSYGTHEHTFTSVGTLNTGGPEDSRIYVHLEELRNWTGVAPTLVEASVSGTPEQVNAGIKQLAKAMPEAEVRPIRQVAEAETTVLGKTRSVLFLSTALISVLVALCVLATLSASVLERRRDFAVMKALGSSQRSLNAVFLAEAMLLAGAGGLVGYAVGCALSAWIGHANFHAVVTPRLEVFPMVIMSSLVIAFIGASLPLLRLQKIEPAAMLRGD
jgi:putative ABC transport system permease protein